MLESLQNNGYLVFEDVMPKDMAEFVLCEMDSIGNGIHPWNSQISKELSDFIELFLLEHGIDTKDRSDIFTFNRPHGEGMYWHDDTHGNTPDGGRIFVACYLTDTRNGGGALKIIPFSHISPDVKFRDMVREAKLASINSNLSIEENFPDVCLTHPFEKTIGVLPGSLIVCDERMIHAVEVNSKSESRKMVLQWMWLK